MTIRVPVKPVLLAWARERSGISGEVLADKFPKLIEWERGEVQPTLVQLERFAKTTHTPFGFLLLQTPPDESVPISDFRTFPDQVVSRPSPDLLDTVYLCQQRQEWYRDFARVNQEQPVEFVGTLTTSTAVQGAAATISETLGFDLVHRGEYATWTAALSGLCERAEDAGVLVMINGVVGSNSHRKLDPQEFRGFALVDSLAPVVFINGADTKAAQIFTLAHELAHIWLGQSALDDATVGVLDGDEIERWCNQVAAEILVPLDAVRGQFDPGGNLTAELDRLARVFKVSTLVVLRRVHDIGWLSWEQYRTEYRRELQRVLALSPERGTGGSFYNTTPVRTSKRFARAVITSTWEGQTLFIDAARLLGFKKLSTLDELATALVLPDDLSPGRQRLY